MTVRWLCWFRNWSRGEVTELDPDTAIRYALAGVCEIVDDDG